MEKLALDIIKKLNSNGYLAYYAGGSVRDMLLDKKAEDIDIATDATPDEVLKIYPFGKTIGAHFGVVMINIQGVNFEIATFRKDKLYVDGRKPEGVIFSDAKEDALRRDFTINGLFFDPLKNKIIDYINGREDIEKKIIKCIGNPADRFQEDHLRLLRAVRFATTLGFKVEDDTYKAVKDNSHLISKISFERIRDEFNKILCHKNRSRGLHLLCDSGLMKEIIPEFILTIGCEQPPEFHPEGDVFTHTMMMIDGIADDADLELILSVFFHDIGKPPTKTYDKIAKRLRFNGHESVGFEMTKKIMSRLKYSNQQIDDVSFAVKRHMMFKDVQKMKKAKLRRFMSSEIFEIELQLHKLDCQSSHGMLDNYNFLISKQNEFTNEPIIPPPFINGKDLIKHGLKPSKIFGKILTEAQDLQLSGELNSREDALKWLKDRILILKK